MNYSAPKVSLARYVAIFCVVYPTLLFIVSVMMNAVDEFTTSVNMPVIIASAGIAKYTFVKRHARTFSMVEFWKMMICALVFDAVLQVVILYLYLGYKSDLVRPWPFVFVESLHGIVIAVGFMPWSRFIRTRAE